MFFLVAGTRSLDSCWPKTHSRAASLRSVSMSTAKHAAGCWKANNKQMSIDEHVYAGYFALSGRSPSAGMDVCMTTRIWVTRHRRWRSRWRCCTQVRPAQRRRTVPHATRMTSAERRVQSERTRTTSGMLAVLMGERTAAASERVSITVDVVDYADRYDVSTPDKRLAAELTIW
jgi:hypothetical protein